MEQEQKDKVIDALLTIAEHIGEYGLNELEAALHYKRQVANAQTEGCNGVAIPSQPPAGHHLGQWNCTKDGWVWQDEIG